MNLWVHYLRATQGLFEGYMSIPVGSVQLTDMCCTLDGAVCAQSVLCAESTSDGTPHTRL